MTSGFSGSARESNLFVDDIAFAVDEEFIEIPCYVAGEIGVGTLVLFIGMPRHQPLCIKGTNKQKNVKPFIRKRAHAVRIITNGFLRCLYFISIIMAARETRNITSIDIQAPASLCMCMLTQCIKCLPTTQNILQNISLNKKNRMHISAHTPRMVSIFFRISRFPSVVSV
jgi:hypothetical protein